MLLQELTRPEQRRGALVDGFPRTVVQVQLLQHLHAKMRELSRRYDATPLSRYFPRPRFRMCILYVDEHESIQRQLSRGRLALEHNKAAAESGEAMVEATVEEMGTGESEPRPGGDDEDSQFFYDGGREATVDDEFDAGIEAAARWRGRGCEQDGQTRFLSGVRGRVQNGTSCRVVQRMPERVVAPTRVNFGS